VQGSPDTNASLRSANRDEIIQDFKGTRTKVEAKGKGTRAKGTRLKEQGSREKN